jgi:1,4-dihydroxy-2-naphthoyl-CoA hydrolase
MMSIDDINRIGEGRLPGLLGFVVTELSEGCVRAEMAVTPQHLAPNGYLHAAAVIALADTAAGYGCRTVLPDGAAGFTTIELKTNFVGTARTGVIECVATVLHRGGTTQVWDSVVTSRETGKTIALFRCTQMVLYPKA